MGDKTKDLHDTFASQCDPAYSYAALPLSVYDGDTLRLNIDLGFGIWRRSTKIRMWGINTPELRGEDKEAGKAARDFLRNLLFDGGEPKPVTLYSIKDRTGKYGRYLGILVKDGKIINEELIKAGHAVPMIY